MKGNGVVALTLTAGLSWACAHTEPTLGSSDDAIQAPATAARPPSPPAEGTQPPPGPMQVDGSLPDTLERMKSADMRLERPGTPCEAACQLAADLCEASGEVCRLSGQHQTEEDSVCLDALERCERQRVGLGARCSCGQAPDGGAAGPDAGPMPAP